MRYGDAAKVYIPQLREQFQNTSSKLLIRKHYEILKNNFSKPKKTQLTSQKIGHAFEKLIRDVLNIYGWQAKKVTLPSGEGNDFTAIFDGHHILGETRWEKAPVKGEAVQAFVGKLAPRPQTIGLMIAYSGFDPSAYEVAKKHMSSRTIVFLKKDHIDKIIVSLTDPGEIFSVELRIVYDYLFENVNKDKTKKT